MLRTNEEFGGSAPDVRRVVFVRGEIDPNNVLGVRDDLEDMPPVITVAGKDHCLKARRGPAASADISHSVPGQLACADVHVNRPDPTAVKEARTLIKQQLTKFLATTD